MSTQPCTAQVVYTQHGLTIQPDTVECAQIRYDESLYLCSLVLNLVLNLVQVISITEVTGTVFNDTAYRDNFVI